MRSQHHEQHITLHLWRPLHPVTFIQSFTYFTALESWKNLVRTTLRQNDFSSPILTSILILLPIKNRKNDKVNTTNRKAAKLIWVTISSDYMLYIEILDFRFLSFAEELRTRDLHCSSHSSFTNYQLLLTTIIENPITQNDVLT